MNIHPEKADDPLQCQNKTTQLLPYLINGSDIISLVDIFSIIWNCKYIIIVCSLLATVAGFIYAITTPEVFSTSANFIIKTGNNSGISSIGELASLAGITMNNSGDVNPSDYLDIIFQDQKFISGLYERNWFFRGDSLPLEDILGIRKDTTISNWKYVFHMSKIEKVRHSGMLDIKKDRKTGILTLKTNTLDPQLSYDISKYTLDYISFYIRKSIKTQAKEKKSFIEERLDEVKVDLQNAESKLTKFKERNLMSNSPQIILEESRLMRQVTLNQEIYIQFRKQYELARIEELNDQNLIQIIKSPEVPVKRSKPKRFLIMIMALLCGTSTGFLISFTYKLLPIIINSTKRNERAAIREDYKLSV